jgi:hypothetical protein
MEKNENAKICVSDIIESIFCLGVCVTTLFVLKSITDSGLKAREEEPSSWSEFLLGHRR